MRPIHQLIAIALAGLLHNEAQACAACFSQADSPLADGMNAGIFTLLAVVTMVLMGIGVFCLHLARRAAAAEIPTPALVSTSLESSRACTGTECAVLILADEKQST